MPDYSINALGQYEIGNSSVREVLLYSLEDVNKDDLPLLGQTFLSSAYLNVDLDSSEFSIASYKATSESDLVPLAPSGCQAPPAISTNAVSSIAPEIPGATSTSIPASRHTSSSKKGLITGIVIGALVATLTIVSSMLWYRRKRATRKHQQRVLASVDKKVADPHLSNPFFYNPELPADKHPPQELPLERNQPAFLPPYEMPGKSSPSLRSMRDHHHHVVRTSTLAEMGT